MAEILLIVVCLCFLGLLLWAERHDNRRLKWIAKPAASLCFVFLAVAGAPPSLFSMLMIAGLVFCLLGDVFLIPKRQISFLAGMGAFALGHAAYTAAFLFSAEGTVLPAVAAGVAMAVFALIALRWLWPHLGAFKWPVAGYAAIIAVMVASAFIATPEARLAPHLPIVFGAVGFAVSDIAVARDQFVKPAFLNRLWGLPLYYGSQLMLALSV